MSIASSVDKAMIVATCAVVLPTLVFPMDGDHHGGGPAVETPQVEKRIGADVAQVLQKVDMARVVIMLRLPQPQSAETMAPVLLRREIARVQEAVLADLDSEEFRVSIRFTNVPALSGELTQAGLVKLKKDPRVVRIDLDVGGSGDVVPSRGKGGKE